MKTRYKVVFNLKHGTIAMNGIIESLEIAKRIYQNENIDNHIDLLKYKVTFTKLVEELENLKDMICSEELKRLENLKI